MTSSSDIQVGDVWLDADNDYVQVVSLPTLQGEGVQVLSFDPYYGSDGGYEDWFPHVTSESYLVELLDRQTEDVPFRVSDEDIAGPDGWTFIGTADLGRCYVAPVGTPEPATAEFDRALDRQGGFYNGGYVTKDSGVRAAYASGMVRDTQEGKPRFDLMWPKGVPYEHQFFTRFAELLARGIQKYGERNWELADSQEEVDRFVGSGDRHYRQYQNGKTDEDHAAAVVFNLLAAETTKWKLNNL